MRTPWRDGTTHAMFSASEFLEKLAVLLPAPARVSRGSMVFQVPPRMETGGVPKAPPERYAAGKITGREAGCIHAQEPEKKLETRRRRNYAWAELMKRVWAIDVLECPRCFGRMGLVAASEPITRDAPKAILLGNWPGELRLG